MSLGDQLKRIQPDMPFKYADLYTVVDLGDDDRTVVISDGNPGGEQTVPCMASYRGRAVGDKVLAVQLGGGSWLCMGKIGNDAAAAASLEYGLGQPAGGGWRQSTTAWIRENPDGSRSVYLDTTGAVPLPATVSATDAAGFLTNSTTRADFPRAGAIDDEQSDWYGAWYYAGGIASACSGKTVARMTVRIARTNGGRNGSTLLRLGLHNSLAGDVLITNQWIPGVSLSRGGSAVIDIPSAQRGLLATGTVQGIAVWGQDALEYAEYTTAADVTITFA